jgi:hypothetical protein
LACGSDLRNAEFGICNQIANQASLPATPKTSVDLLWDITKAIRDAENARTLISILVHKGSITSQPQLQCVLQKLRRAGAPKLAKFLRPNRDCGEATFLKVNDRFNSKIVDE